MGVAGWRLEHFRAKRVPVRVKKMRQNKRLKPGSDSIRTGKALAHMKKTLRLRAVVVGVLEELPFICPVAVAIGSLIMIGITLCKDWPQ